MALLPILPQVELDYTRLVRQDMLVRLQFLFNQVNPYWRDFSTVHPENLLLEGMVTITDMHRGVMEERVRQLFWATVTERLPALRLGRADGFVMPAATAPSVTITVTLPNGATATKDIRIPIQTEAVPYGLNAQTSDPQNPKRYHLDYAVHAEGTTNVWKNPADNTLWYIFATGETSATLTFEGASVYNAVYESALVPNQEVLLDNYPYIEGSAVVTSDGNLYAELTDPTFVGVGPSERVFLPRTDSEGRGRLLFGSGINGVIPPGNIDVVYKVGGGRNAEVDAGSSWTVVDPVFDADGDPVTLVLNNAAASSTAQDAMTVEEARVLGPLQVRTKERAVIDDDFETVGLLEPGIARAAVITSNHDSGINEDEGLLLLVGEGEKLASGRFAPAASVTAAQVAAVQAKIADGGSYEALMGFRMTVIGVGSDRYHLIQVAVKIYKATGYSAADAKTSVTNALKDHFAVTLVDRSPNPAMDFGSRLKNADGVVDQLLLWGGVFNAVYDAAGVRTIDASTTGLLLNNLRSDITIDPQDFPKLDLDNLFIYDMDQGGVLL